MKKDFLFPHAWRVPGWILTALFGAAGLAWSIDFVVWYTPDGKMQQVSDLLGGWIDEVIVIGLMAGLLLVAFSRERDEDEYTTRLRASSLVWAVLADSLFVLLATCFLYEFAYLYALFLRLFSAARTVHRQIQDSGMAGETGGPEDRYLMFKAVERELKEMKNSIKVQRAMHDMTQQEPFCRPGGSEPTDHQCGRTRQVRSVGRPRHEGCGGVRTARGGGLHARRGGLRRPVQVAGRSSGKPSVCFGTVGNGTCRTFRCDMSRRVLIAGELPGLADSDYCTCRSKIPLNEPVTL